MQPAKPPQLPRTPLLLLAPAPLEANLPFFRPGSLPPPLASLFPDLTDGETDASVRTSVFSPLCYAVLL